MSIKVAINGFGRIGRLCFRQMFEEKNFQVVAINDLGDKNMLTHLLKFDSTQGAFKYRDVTKVDGDNLVIKNKKIKFLQIADAKELPWKKLKIDIVLECTGFYCSKEKSMSHIEDGAKKVVISAPSGNDLKTIVFNVNHDTLTGDEEIISAASCTTNCLAPVVDVIDKAFTINKGYMTTVHAYTNDQATLDVPHSKGIKARRGRAAAANIVPTSTGAASAIGKVCPNLEGRLDGVALKHSQNETLTYTEDPVVSSDVIGRRCGALVDGLLTDVLEVDGKKLVKVIAWYDNEMGYTAQMVRTAKYLMEN